MTRCFKMFFLPHSPAYIPLPVLHGGVTDHLPGKNQSGRLRHALTGLGSHQSVKAGLCWKYMSPFFSGCSHTLSSSLVVSVVPIWFPVRSDALPAPGSVWIAAFGSYTQVAWHLYYLSGCCVVVLGGRPSLWGREGGGRTSR